MASSPHVCTREALAGRMRLHGGTTVSCPTTSYSVSLLITTNIRYWDETYDSGRFSSSDVFNTRDGFGGNGRDGDEENGGCIRDGPFAKYVLHIGPGYENTEHCITRSINNEISLAASQNSVDNCLSQPNFENAWPCIETNPHVAGHRGVGGGMVDIPIQLWKDTSANSKP